MARKLFISLFLFVSIIQLSAFAWGADLDANDVSTIRNFEGEFVSVTGYVHSTHIAKSGKVRFLNFGPDYRNAFTVVIFTGDLNKFLASVGEPTNYYKGKIVRVEGRIKIYKDKPEIIVNNPDQIIVIKK